MRTQQLTIGPMSPPGPMWPQGPMGPGPIGPFAIMGPFGTMGPFMWPPLLPFMANVLSQCGGLWRTNCVVLSGCFCGKLRHNGSHTAFSQQMYSISSYIKNKLMIKNYTACANPSMDLCCKYLPREASWCRAERSGRL